MDHSLFIIFLFSLALIFYNFYLTKNKKVGIQNDSDLLDLYMELQRIKSKK